MRALNSSGVLDETTEEGRLFQSGIVMGKNEFFRASLFKVNLNKRKDVKYYSHMLDANCV